MANDMWFVQARVSPARYSSARAKLRFGGVENVSALAPSLRLLENDPEVELQLFDEEADAEAWVALAVPGSPYGVVLAHDGEVLAKGTFNSLFQLESLLAHATRPVHA